MDLIDVLGCHISQQWSLPSPPPRPRTYEPIPSGSCPRCARTGKDQFTSVHALKVPVWLGLWYSMHSSISDTLAWNRSVLEPQFSHMPVWHEGGWVGSSLWMWHWLWQGLSIQLLFILIIGLDGSSTGCCSRSPAPFMETLAGFRETYHPFCPRGHDTCASGQQNPGEKGSF